MQREFAIASPQEKIEDFLARSGQEAAEPIVVVEDGTLRGLVYREKLFEFLYLQGLRRSRLQDAHSGDNSQFGL